MKFINRSRGTFLFIFSWLLLMIFQGCDKYETRQKFNTIMPVLVKLKDLRAMTFTLEQSKGLSATGKIYLYKNHLFINEPQKGIHIYNNENPSSPKSVGFLSIPGNFDLAIQNDLPYVDNVTDLVTFDISDIAKPKQIDRQKDVFAVRYFMDGVQKDVLSDEYMVPIAYKDSLVDFTYQDTYIPSYRIEYDSYAENGNSVGQAGSMARFALNNNHLFAIFGEKIKAFDLRNGRSPAFKTDVALGFGIETLFPYKDNLFVGANDGMHILNVKNPLAPEKLATYTHIRACDPVVVNDKYAFVTLRSGTNCNTSQNVLEVVDIQDLRKPILVSKFQMKNPHGLALSGNSLYVCEGDFGFKSFRINDVMDVDNNEMEYLQNLKSFDVIAGPKSLIVIGKESVCQFDYSDPAKLKQLSCISVIPSK